MGKLIDETGNRYNRLTVIKRQGNDVQGRAAWLCKCDCGNETVVSGGNLRTGMVKSCGCSRYLGEGEAAFNRLVRSLSRAAIRRGYVWDLSDETVKLLTQKNCAYCGAPPNNICKGSKSNYIYNGLDRVDNTKGYEINNVVPCCVKCNYAKHIMTTEEFFDWIKRVYDNCRFFLGR